MGKKSVLVVDDEPYIAELLRIHLKGQGYSVSVATSASQALRLAGKRPSLITLDMMLSKQGMGLLRKLKHNPFTRNIPVMVITVADNVEQYYRAGAACVFQKPFDSELVLERIQNLCS